MKLLRWWAFWILWWPLAMPMLAFWALGVAIELLGAAMRRGPEWINFHWPDWARPE